MSADSSVSWHYGITLWHGRMCEQLLLQKYKAQILLFLLKDTLSIKDEKLFMQCRDQFVCLFPRVIKFITICSVTIARISLVSCAYVPGHN